MFSKSTQLMYLQTVKRRIMKKEEKNGSLKPNEMEELSLVSKKISELQEERTKERAADTERFYKIARDMETSLLCTLE